MDQDLKDLFSVLLDDPAKPEIKLNILLKGQTNVFKKNRTNVKVDYLDFNLYSTDIEIKQILDLALKF
jgi:hypothetical protein